MKHWGLFLLLLLQILLPIQAQADVIYPARLEIKEVEPGVFSVRFILPMINNRRVRAEPVLPSVCRDIAEKEIRVTANNYTEIRRVECAPDLLFGTIISVKGLIGTKIDVILFLDMLNGRSYKATLKPAKAVFKIPHPPSLLDLGNSAGLAGVRRIVSRPEAFLFLFLIVFLEIRRRNILLLGCGFFVGCAVGQHLFVQQWLQLSPQLPVLVTLIAVLLPSIEILRRETNPLGWFRPLIIFGLLLGLLFGGSASESIVPDGLSTIESSLAFVIHMLGIGIGTLLAYYLIVELRHLLFMIPFVAKADQRDRFVAYAAGILAASSIFYHLSSFLVLPSLIPEAPPELYILALSVGIWLGLPESTPKSWASLFLLIPFVVGIFLGHSEITLPLGSFFVTGTLFLSGVAITVGLFNRLSLSLPILAIALLYHGWNSAAFIEENLSLPISVSVGAASICLLMFLLARNAVAMRNWDQGMPIIRITGGTVALVALAFRMGDYADWFERTLAGEMTLGFVRLPALALVSLAAAALVWPRRRRILQILDIKMQKPVLHWVLLSLSFFILPLGTIQVRNIFHEPTAPVGDNARRILTHVLSNTYHAFNLDDEDQLYNMLSETVSAELVDDVYLDSRRKLTSGVRQGAEVTVRNVNVEWVAEEIKGSNAIEGYTYECRWSVTARVRHLQHVHHRQNIYTGSLLVQSIDGKWKIGDIALISEDRIIIPWGTG